MQLERRNINILIPSPFAEKHDAWLRRHLLTGEGSVLERVRIMLGRHSSGSIFPFRILVRAGYGIDGSHNFLATMKPINSADNYLVSVTACSRLVAIHRTLNQSFARVRVRKHLASTIAWCHPLSTPPSAAP